MNNLAKNFNIDEIKQNISLIDKETELFEFEKKYFAVSGGLLSSALANMKNLKPEVRKEAGIFLNKIKITIRLSSFAVQFFLDTENYESILCVYAGY